MGVLEEDFERVGGEVGEVVDREFFEGVDHRGRFFGCFGGKGVGFKFMFAREDAVADAEDQIDRCVEEKKEDEPGVEWGTADSECFIESLFADEERQDKKHQHR